MHPVTRETLDDINRVETERREHLANNVVQFIGREFRRRFPTRTLIIRFVNGYEFVNISDKRYEDTDVRGTRREPLIGFIWDYLDDVTAITEDWTRGCPNDLESKPSDNKSQTAITALNNLDLDNPEKAYSEADDILMAYLTLIGSGNVADAYKRVVARLTEWTR